MMLFIMLIVKVVILGSILMIHYKTNNVKEVAFSWGIIVVLIAYISDSFFNATIVGFFAFLLALILFFLSNYLKNTILTRIIFLVMIMVVLFIAPRLMLEAIL